MYSRWKGVHIQTNTHDKLSAYCDANGLKIGFVVTKAVEEYLALAGSESDTSEKMGYVKVAVIDRETHDRLKEYCKGRGLRVGMAADKAVRIYLNTLGGKG